MIEYEEQAIRKIDRDLSDEHLRDKEKRLVGIERQKARRQRLRNAISHGRWCKPSIWRDCEWDKKLETFVYTDRVKRHKNSKAQKWMKKTSERTVRHLPVEALPPKGNHYRKSFDYWWIWM